MSLRSVFDRENPTFPLGTPCWVDASFQHLLAQHPQFAALQDYLPNTLSTKVFDDQETIETVWSSYKDHGYGYLFYALTRVFKPSRCVELGVLQGFSLLTVAAALRDNGQGFIQGFDLFEDYPYHHEQYANVSARISNLGLQQWASIQRSDAFAVAEQFDSIDYLHVDISNNGDVYRRVFEQWAGKVTQLILFEGGSAERDQVEWMQKYQKPAITMALEDIRATYPEWSITVLNPFPSLTVAVRKPAH